MRFFTPVLYLQFNSPDDEIANEADKAWEEALTRYQRHLEVIKDQMPEQARALAELHLHDCEVLGWDEATLPDLRDTGRPFPVWSAFSVLSVRRDSEVFSLNYVLWDKIRRYPAPDGWPFSKSRPHWLYDEIDVAADEPGRFMHRILFSDGTTAEIPFAIVFVHSVAWERSDGGVEHAGGMIDGR
jgi:hypothetical protein